MALSTHAEDLPGCGGRDGGLEDGYHGEGLLLGHLMVGLTNGPQLLQPPDDMIVKETKTRSVGWLVGWSLSQSVGQSVGWLVGQSVGWSGSQLVGWSVGRSVGWLVGQLVSRSVGFQFF